MSDLLGLLEMLLAYGGFGAIGLLVLVSGLFAARRTSSVITCAVVAVLLFTVQVGFYAFLLSFARFSGDGGRSETIIRWLSLVGGALVIGFLVFTLPRTWGKTIATPHWLRDGAKIASALIIAYVLYLVGIMALRQVYPPPAWSPPASLTTWLTVLADLVLAWGLWQDYGGLVCGTRLHRICRVPDCLVRAAEAVGSALPFYSIAGRCESALADLAARRAAVLKRAQALRAAETRQLIPVAERELGGLKLFRRA